MRQRSSAHEARAGVARHLDAVVRKVRHVVGMRNRRGRVGDRLPVGAAVGQAIQSARILARHEGVRQALEDDLAVAAHDVVDIAGT
jgi:hypothetical protein